MLHVLESTPLGVSISPEKLLKVRFRNLEHVIEKAGPELLYSNCHAVAEFTFSTRFKGKVRIKCLNEEDSVTVLHSWISSHISVFDILTLFQENIELLLNVVKRVYSHVVGLALLPPLLALRWGHERLLALRSILLWTTEQYMPFSSWSHLSVLCSSNKYHMDILYEVDSFIDLI